MMDEWINDNEDILEGRPCLITVVLELVGALSEYEAGFLVSKPEDLFRKWMKRLADIDNMIPILVKYVKAIKEDKEILLDIEKIGKRILSKKKGMKADVDKIDECQKTICGAAVKYLEVKSLERMLEKIHRAMNRGDNTAAMIQKNQLKEHADKIKDKLLKLSNPCKDSLFARTNFASIVRDTVRTQIAFCEIMIKCLKYFQGDGNKLDTITLMTYIQSKLEALKNYDVWESFEAIDESQEKDHLNNYAKEIQEAELKHRFLYNELMELVPAVKELRRKVEKAMGVTSGPTIKSARSESEAAPQTAEQKAVNRMARRGKERRDKNR